MPAIKLGKTSINKICLGNVKIIKVYFKNNLIFNVANNK